MQPRNRRKIYLGFLLTLLLLILLVVPAWALIGDINLDDLVDQADLAPIAENLGISYTNPQYNRFLDLNLDNYLNVKDLAIAGRSYGSTRNFHYPRQISNSTTSSSVVYVSSCIDGSGRIHILWSEDSTVFYTRLDRFGNTLIDDLALDHHAYSGDDGLAIGCDSQGNSHMIWDCYDSTQSKSKTCQARIDAYGYQRVKNYLDSQRDTLAWPAVALDASHRAHILYTEDVVNKTFYTLVDANGQVQVAQQIVPQARRYHELVVDQEDAVHLLYPVYTDTHRLAYQRIGLTENDSLPMRTIAHLGWEGSFNDSIRPSLALDAGRNVYASYMTFGVLPANLYLEKLDANGNTLIDGKLIFPQFDLGGSGQAQTDIAVDSGGNLHMVSYTDFNPGTGAYHTAYGVFNPNADPLQPMRWIIYGQTIRTPTLLLDANQDAHLVYLANDTSGYPPCARGKLCYQSTSFESSTYQLSLPDLGSDVAHLSWNPVLARWNDSVVITGTVFNAGWATSPAAVLQASALTSETGGTLLAQSNVSIPALAARQTYVFRASLTLPPTPPAGFETLEFLRLTLEVDPAHQIAETTEANNRVSAPVPIMPVPTQTKLYLAVHDDTLTALGEAESAEYLDTGQAYIEGPGYPRKTVTVNDYFTVLAEDIPVGSAEVTYTIGWQAAGYRPAAPTQITVKRNAADPYQIDFTPRNTAVIVTDRWGSLSGVISHSDSGGGPLANARVRLVGQGLSIEAVTDASGLYSPASQAALGKLIPGVYQVRISRDQYARLVDTLTIQPLQAHTYSRTLDPTDKAYLHGNVINEFGNPVPGALVDACGAQMLTDAQGVFDLEAPVACAALTITRAGYASFSQPLSLVAGQESLLEDLLLEFDPPVYALGGGDRVASRVVDMSTGDILPDAPADAGFALTKLYEKFKDEFWMDYRILILYGCYEYNLTAAYSGTSGDYHLQFIQIRLAPRTFEVHMSLSSVQFLGVTIPIPIVSDSGLRTALYAIEARLVNTATGQVIKTVRNPIEGGSSWVALDDTTKTYSFDGAAFSDLSDMEVWFYLKAGLNDGGQFDSSPLLYQYNQQILKLNLGSGEITGTYLLGDFPLP